MNNAACIASWGTLSIEIRQLILQDLVEEGSPRPTDDGQVFRLSSIVTVSREWQDFFEMHNFRHLYHSDRELPGFSELVQGQNASWLNYTTNLRVHIQFSQYGCPDCAEQRMKQLLLRK